MDYSMPLCDGMKTTELMRDIFKVKLIDRAKQPYIALLTAYSDRSYFARAYKKGVDLCMVKPIFQLNMHQILSKSGLLS